MTPMAAVSGFLPPLGLSSHCWRARRTPQTRTAFSRKQQGRAASGSMASAVNNADGFRGGSKAASASIRAPSILPGVRRLDGGVGAVGATASSSPGVLDAEPELTLDTIRDALIRQEDSIIYHLLERAQFCINAPTYDANAFSIPEFEGSLVEYMLKETEKLHAKVRRYTAPDEHPFFPDGLPQPILPSFPHPKVLHKVADEININPLIWKMYFDDLLPGLVAKGDDGNYGSAATCDVLCLQALSRRIHFGKYVAEAKYRESPETFNPHIRAQDVEELYKLVTFETVELKVQRRVENKAVTFGQEVVADGTRPQSLKIDPRLVGRLYWEWVMPLTKKVQVQYLLHRLD